MIQNPSDARVPSGYRFIRLLGKGRTGTVLLCEQRRLRRMSAVKWLDGEDLPDEETIERFLAEARITSNLSHPNIVVVYDQGLEDGVPWIAFEYLDGGTLRARLIRGPLSLAESAPVLTQIASALDAAHGVKILHRDVKPENVFHDEKGICKLGDFGISRGPGTSIRTRSGIVLGTIGYLAPEIIRGEPASVKSDLYALAVTFHEMVTGRRPFEGSSPREVYDRQIGPRPPLGIGPGGKVAVLEAVLARALDPDPANRPESVAVFHHEFEDAVEIITGSRHPLIQTREVRRDAPRSRDLVQTREASREPSTSQISMVEDVSSPTPTPRPAPSVTLSAPKLVIAGSLVMLVVGFLTGSWLLRPPPAGETSVTVSSPAATPGSPSEAVCGGRDCHRRIGAELSQMLDVPRTLVEGGSFDIVEDMSGDLGSLDRMTRVAEGGTVYQTVQRDFLRRRPEFPEWQEKARVLLPRLREHAACFVDPDADPQQVLALCDLFGASLKGAIWLDLLPERRALEDIIGNLKRQHPTGWAVARISWLWADLQDDYREKEKLSEQAVRAFAHRYAEPLEDPAHPFHLLWARLQYATLTNLLVRRSWEKLLERLQSIATRVGPQQGLEVRRLLVALDHDVLQYIPRPYRARAEEIVASLRAPVGP